MKKQICIAVFFYITTLCYSQNKIVLKVALASSDKRQRELLVYKKEHTDSISVLLELQKLLIKFREQSYILASSDSTYRIGDTIFAQTTIGSSWKWAKLNKGNVQDNLLSKVDFKSRSYTNARYKSSEIAVLQKKILKYSQNNGFPFATIGLDSVSIDNNKLEASLNYQAGPHIVYDSLVIIGSSKAKRKFLINYLRIFPGQPYSQDKIDQMDKRLKELPYLKQTKPYAILFTKDRAIISLYLQDQRSNQVDGIIGFLPNESSQKKLLLTGELNLDLKNMFGTGKNLMVEWRKFDKASQILNISYLHPRLLTTNLDLRIDFNLLKQDSSFLNIARRITISQGASKAGKLNFFGGLNTSREFVSDKIGDKSSLPPYSNYNYYIYGLGYNWSSLNDIFYPRKGWFITTQGSIGNKSIYKIPGYVDSLYNNIQLKSVQLSITLKVEKFFKISKSAVVLSKLETGHIFNNQKNIFYNDMYRVGGLKSLRGFNENNFYALTYGLATLEYRFFTDNTTYLLLFFDQGYIRNPLNKAIPYDYPFGFGTGISFTTNVGVFNFIYSLGNAKSQKLNVNLSKIHFGVISRF